MFILLTLTLGNSLPLPYRPLSPPFLPNRPPYRSRSPALPSRTSEVGLIAAERYTEPGRQTYLFRCILGIN